MLKQQKKLMRQKVLSKALLTRDQLLRESAAVFKILSTLPCYQRAARISVYLSMEKSNTVSCAEVNTDLIVKDLIGGGGDKSVFVPRCFKTPVIHMKMLKLKSMHDWINMPLNSFGIKEPVDIDDREDGKNLN